jgi:hypothetical protein
VVVDKVTDVFIYDETSPSCLRWKVDRGSRAKKGDPCGTWNKINKRWHVQFNGSPKPVSRLVWEYFNGESPEGFIEFNNGDVADNRIENLSFQPYRETVIIKENLHGTGLREIFDYRDGKLYWKVDSCSGVNGTVVNASKGDSLFESYDQDGYFRCKLKGRQRLHHRLIWEWHYGKIPKGMEIDHYDRNRVNNRIDNLRMVTSKTNARNVSMSSRNKTGTVGVRVRNIGERGEQYIAFWRENGVQTDRCFSVSKYGKEEALRLAIETREIAIKRLNEELGYGYTPHHGK